MTTSATPSPILHIIGKNWNQEMQRDLEKVGKEAAIKEHKVFILMLAATPAWTKATGQNGTAVKKNLSKLSFLEKEIPHSNTKSGPTPDTNVNVSRGPQADQPVKAWGMALSFIGKRDKNRKFSNQERPQQNGSSERINRNPYRAARTMLADSHYLPLCWVRSSLKTA
ncbi:hypothetical protein Tco_0277046 [Tanacetum coccineum]